MARSYVTLPAYVLFLCALSCGNAANVGIFAFFGYYSHDQYTNHLATTLANETNHNVSVLQVKLFQPTEKRVKFTQPLVCYDRSDDQENVFQTDKKVLLQRILDILALSDLTRSFAEGLTIMLDHEVKCMRGCEAASTDEKFLSQIRDLRLDFMAVDVNHCAAAFAKWLKIPFCHAVASGGLAVDYLIEIGVPSNPAYVPHFFANFEPYETFLDRLLNSAGYAGLIAFQNFYNRRYTNEIFRKKQPSAFEDEKSLMFSSSWEMFLDKARPVARNARYFGCFTCAGATDQNELMIDTTEKAAGYIVVSFGSIFTAEKFPIEHLQNLAQSFSQFPRFIFLWQLDISMEAFQKTVLSPAGMTMPKNVRLHRWLPLKQLLAHPKVALFIMHGGAAMCVEAAYSAVPVVAMALHSDHFYNSQRMEHRGLGTAMMADEIDQESVTLSIDFMLKNIQWYKMQAIKFRQMLLDYHNFEKRASVFWLDFVIRHFGGRSEAGRVRAKKYWTLRYPRSWSVYFNCDVMSAVVIFYCFLMLIISA